MREADIPGGCFGQRAGFTDVGIAARPRQERRRYGQQQAARDPRYALAPVPAAAQRGAASAFSRE
ncbi:MAG: hypothetical protein F4Y74_01675 [Gemmatimonadales bacterium]|nr:hypothetical protein [Gemmatimonadales bacterium]MYG20595.1 hypothetical protein [Gemmatimonadales bacterium]